MPIYIALLPVFIAGGIMTVVMCSIAWNAFRSKETAWIEPLWDTLSSRPIDELPKSSAMAALKAQANPMPWQSLWQTSDEAPAIPMMLAGGEVFKKLLADPGGPKDEEPKPVLRAFDFKDAA